MRIALTGSQNKSTFCGFQEVILGLLFRHSASKVSGQTGSLCPVKETKEQSSTACSERKKTFGLSDISSLFYFSMNSLLSSLRNAAKFAIDLDRFDMDWTKLVYWCVGVYL